MDTTIDPVPRHVRSTGATTPGRNLRDAIVIGVVLAALALASLLHPVLFLVVLTAAMLIGAYEVQEAVGHARLDVPVIPVAIGIVSMMVAAYLRGPEMLAVATGLSMVAVVLWRATDGFTASASSIAGGLLTLLYPAALGGFAALMVAEPAGRTRIAVFILVTVFSDIGGYAAGVRFGRHPMAPSLSPKKSWEGFAGSVLACGVVGALAVWLLLDGAWWGGAVLGVLVAGCATVGDLIESSIKRDVGIKDMSNILPGHGGIMDRLDSLVVCAPVAWAGLRILVPYA